jgi:hypothetical protein
MPAYFLFIPIFGIVCGSAVLITLMVLIARHVSQKRSMSMGPDNEILRRLERIEQIVDTTAVEVERLSESNRFVAKLLAEKSEAVPR